MRSKLNEEGRCDCCGRPAEAFDENGHCWECERDALNAHQWAAQAVRELLEALTIAARSHLTALDIEEIVETAARGEADGERRTCREIDHRLRELQGRRLAVRKAQVAEERARERLSLDDAEANALRRAVRHALAVGDLDTELRVERAAEDEAFAEQLAENARWRGWLAALLHDANDGVLRVVNVDQELLAILERAKSQLEDVALEEEDKRPGNTDASSSSWPVLTACEALLDRLRALTGKGG